MKRAIIVSAIGAILGAMPGVCQEPRTGPAPIYSVTVIERSLKAVNYQYRSGPTLIDFRGTVLLPKARGEATVESRQGRTEIDARFENLTPTQRFGREYLTYVLWTISPEGRPHNIGEIVPNGSNNASLRVTTDLQAFGMIVTAEPYSAVRQPSDVVVAENQIRPETVGKIEEVDTKYELMPRGHYTWNVSQGLEREVENAPRVSMRKYEALSELYQAQNAIAIAKTARADQYAPNTLAKAEQLLLQAQQLDGNGAAPPNQVVESAREAAQTAEDARVIAEQHQQEDKLTQAKAQAFAAQQAAAQADAEVQRARAEAAAVQAQAEADRVARERAEADAAAARDRAARAESEAAASQARANAALAELQQNQRRDQGALEKSGLRRQLLEQFNSILITMDTPRGLVVVIPGRLFSGPAVPGAVAEQVMRIAALVAAHPGLRIEVEGHTDSEITESVASRRADAVRDVLIARGLPPGVVSARGVGNSRPLVSNSTESGREENRRVEIVVSGDPIGNVPFWDRTYSLTERKNGQ